MDMNRIEKNCIYIVIAILILVFDACKTGNTSISTHNIDSKVSKSGLNWLICIPDFSMDKKWEDYTVLSQISDDVAIIPNVECLSDNFDIKISEMLASDSLPDLITLRNNCDAVQRLNVSGKTAKINDFSQIMQYIPRPVLDQYLVSDKNLYAVPGGFSNPNDFTMHPLEGLFVNKNFYQLLGKPDTDTTEKLLKAIEKFKKLHYGNNENIDFTPVVFGVNGSGISTLEHLFNIMPIYEETHREADQAHSPNIKNLLNFFSRLRKSGVSDSAMELPRDMLLDLMPNNVLFYFGGVDFISYYNHRYPDSPYIMVMPPVQNGGGLEAKSVYGLYSTFIANNDNIKTSVKFVSYMLSPDGSKTAMAGIDRQQRIDDNGTIIPLPDAMLKIESGDQDYINDTGITVIPFLSSVGTDYVSIKNPVQTKLIDLFDLNKKSNPFPTSREGIAGYQIQNDLMELYKDALSGSYDYNTQLKFLNQIINSKNVEIMDEYIASHDH